MADPLPAVMKTLVLSQRFTDDSNTLWRAAIEEGWEIVRAHGFRVDPVAGDAVLYGETLFADLVTEALGVDVVGPNDAWLPSLPSWALGRRIALTPLSAARSRGDFPRFIKPPDDKLFAARVYESAASFAELTAGIDPGTQVLVSDPVRFDVEYRAFVADRRVEALSPYIRGGVIAEGWQSLPGEREAATAFLERLLFEPAVALPPSLVIDVGRLSTEVSAEWVVVEGNPAWASGICGCDPTAVLKVLAAATVPRGSCPMWARPASWTPAGGGP